MMQKALLSMMLAVSPALAQTVTGSISGGVYEAGAKTPMADVDVFANMSGKIRTKTDAQGHYSLRDLKPGQYTIHVYAGQGQGAHGSKVIALKAGQDFETLDFYLRGQGEIAGKVLDENKEPVAGVNVFLVAREYQLGALRYVFATGAASDDQGEYHLRGVEPGRAYLVMAGGGMRQLDALSNVPVNPKMRKPALMPSLYPDTPSMEGAQPLVLRAGEHREGIDIRMSRGPSYCIDGVLESGAGPGTIRFSIAPRKPTSGQSGDGGFFTMPPGGTTGPDGKIRLCDLSPGEYEITAMQFPSASVNTPLFLGTSIVTIADRDVHNVRVMARPQVRLSGEVVWASTPPDKPVEKSLSIWFEPLTRPIFMGETTDARTSVPGVFSLAGLFMDDYWPHIFGLSEGMYFKDITYAGASILHDSLRLGSATGDAALRLVVAHDGGFVSVIVTDKDGNPVPDSYVLAMPDGSNTEASLADALISGQTDQNGAYKSEALAPGKYYVLVSDAPLDKSPESIGKLWRARTHGTEIEVKPSATVELALKPTAVN